MLLSPGRHDAPRCPRIAAPTRRHCEDRARRSVRQGGDDVTSSRFAKRCLLFRCGYARSYQDTCDEYESSDPIASGARTGLARRGIGISLLRCNASRNRRSTMSSGFAVWKGGFLWCKCMCGVVSGACGGHSPSLRTRKKVEADSPEQGSLERNGGSELAALP